MLRVKTKLSLGLGFLFTVIIVLIITGQYALNRLSGDAEAVLKDNYNSLEYVALMQEALDQYVEKEMDLQHFQQRFAEPLVKQAGNITEPGEKELVETLQAQYETLLKTETVQSGQIRTIRDALHRINEMNRAAIIRKSEQAKSTAGGANLAMGVITAICFLVSFIFIFNFPGYIADPIRLLTEGIRQIADKNYGERLHFKSRDEFGELASAFNNMAGRLDAYENSNLAKLLFEKKRLETLLDNMSDAVLILDENSRILFSNPVACQLMAVKKMDIIGKYAPDAALHNDLLRTLLKTAAADSLKIYYNEKESFFQKETIAVRVERPNVPADAGVVILLKNITPFKELDLAKTNFIATISHELKTPISSIKMSLSLLGDGRVGELNEEQQKLLAHIRDDSQRLLDITGELLDLAQVETGNIRLNRGPVAAADLLRFAASAVEMQAAQKNISILLQPDPDLPQLSLDPDKTTWVLVNLLTNAIRHSPEAAPVNVKVTLTGPEMIFSVRDSGPGIPSEYQAHLFERFYQSPGKDSNIHAGSGLGLAIAREFIEVQGGRIWMESTPGSGSTFYFAFPLK